MPVATGREGVEMPDEKERMMLSIVASPAELEQCCEFLYLGEEGHRRCRECGRLRALAKRRLS